MTKDAITSPTARAGGREMPWHMRDAAEVLRSLQSSAEGLRPDEAARRLAESGLNVLHEARRIRAIEILGRQFRSLLIWILLAAAIIAAIIGDRIDFIAIIAIVILNALFGFWQEFTAEKSIAALKKLTAPQAKAWRDGKVISIPASHVVRGDVIQLEAGDLIPADARVIQSTALTCIESALTGESESVAKTSRALDDARLPLAERINLAFMGTSVAGGAGRAVVFATGMQTEIGRIAQLLEAPQHEETPLQRKLHEFGRLLVWIALALVALLALAGWLRGLEPVNLFLTAVSLAVAAVPEGLPAVVTIALALGVMRMAKRKALVRSLAAVETLGCTNVICTDKTGTLTIGEMTVRELYVAGRTFHVTGQGYGPAGEILFEGSASNALHAGDLLELAGVFVASNNAHLHLEDGKWTVIGEPTEGALLSAAHKAGARHENVERDLPKHHEIPFDPERKRRTVVRLMPDGHLRAFVNGAPELLLDRCSRIHTGEGVRAMTEHDRAAITSKCHHMSGRGLRILASAYRKLDTQSATHLSAHEIESGLVFVGLTGMHDMPRPEARAAIERCRAAGIRVVMITGDHPRTALAIARELGIAKGNEEVLSGAELNDISNEELRRRAPQISVYARTTPEHKLRIIDAWKANRAVVAMTGDGVNDAPALRGADIGVAMGGQGTEVAKQASDLILTDNNFSTIVAAVEEGRGIFENIRKTIRYLLASNASELMVMSACVAVGAPLPLLPIHLLWINLVTDGPPALCLAADRVDGELMKQPPRSAQGSIADRRFLLQSALVGLLVAAIALTVFGHALRNADLATARTCTFGFLVFAQLLLPFSLRGGRPLRRANQGAPWKLMTVAAALIVVQIAIHISNSLASVLKIVPLSVGGASVLVALALIPVALIELYRHGCDFAARRRALHG